METVRAFIAIELTPEVRAELAKIESNLKKAGGRAARWVNPEGIHLTLCFLGSITESQVTQVQEAIVRTAACFGPFELRLGHTGAFPDITHPQTIWVGLTGDMAHMANIQTRLVKELLPAGYKPENRPFRPHLTLARVRPEATPIDRQNLAAAVARPTEVTGSIVMAKDISLMKSQLTPAGAVYTRLSKTPLECR